MGLNLEGKEPTCGHNSCAMVLDTLGKPVNVESLIATLKPTQEGILSKEVSNLLSKNNVENLFLNGRTINDISRYTDKGTPVIVRITDSKNPKEFSHFVVVDGITERAGQEVVAIRDPHGKSYFSPLETFKNAFTGEAIIPRNFK
jgi:ABC-type bacteriocin/lantibiotic exporter with double-glycine peptidase domain